MKFMSGLRSIRTRNPDKDLTGLAGPRWMGPRAVSTLIPRQLFGVTICLGGRTCDSIPAIAAALSLSSTKCSCTNQTSLRIAYRAAKASPALHLDGVTVTVATRNPSAQRCSTRKL